MIKKLKRKFIALSMIVILVMLVIIMTVMNVLNYNSLLYSADETLGILAQNRGMLPTTLGYQTSESQYSSRFFSVFLSKTGIIINTDTKNIASVDAVTAIDYAQKVLDSGEYSGFVDSYRYVVNSERNGLRIIFLDCCDKLSDFKKFLYISLIAALAGYIAVFVIVFVLAGRIIRPVAESYEKQKRFITDAGHEMKTPLTVIGANADILEMELGDGNESLADIQSQTKRLRELTDELVMLARMEESESALAKIEFPISDVVTETAHPFYALAESGGKTLNCSVKPLLTLNGNAKAIGQLVSVFLENALKYSPEGGAIVLKLYAQGRTIVLSVSNPTVMKIEREQLSHVFDRFYRSDSSRNSETGGHGIGLSIAKAIVSAHGGKISADTNNGNDFEITAVFPL